MLPFDWSMDVAVQGSWWEMWGFAATCSRVSWMHFFISYNSYPTTNIQFYDLDFSIEINF